MTKFKYPLITAGGAFLLSFLVGLIFGVGIVTVLFRAVILALLVGAFTFAVMYVFTEILELGVTTSNEDNEDEEEVPHKVDIRIDDDQGFESDTDSFSDAGGLDLPQDGASNVVSTDDVLEELSNASAFISPDILAKNEDEPQDFVVDGTDTVLSSAGESGINAEPELMAKAIQTVLAEDSNS